MKKQRKTTSKDSLYTLLRPRIAASEYNKREEDCCNVSQLLYWCPVRPPFSGVEGPLSNLDAGLAVMSVKLWKMLRVRETPKLSIIYIFFFFFFSFISALENTFVLLGTVFEVSL